LIGITRQKSARRSGTRLSHFATWWRLESEPMANQIIVAFHFIVLAIFAASVLARAPVDEEYQKKVVWVCRFVFWIVLVPAYLVSLVYFIVEATK